MYDYFGPNKRYAHLGRLVAKHRSKIAPVLSIREIIGFGCGMSSSVSSINGRSESPTLTLEDLGRLLITINRSLADTSDMRVG